MREQFAEEREGLSMRIEDLATDMVEKIKADEALEEEVEILVSAVEEQQHRSLLLDEQT